ncbi:hypothetical protein [Streptomyces sp. AK08-01B]|uniref:hypothetical protein n=1 Tax=unclassified Streptomyces TaxID=2593676 RepID=UPI0039F5D049
MTSSSRSPWVCVSTDRTAAPRVAAELYTGITTDTRGTALLVVVAGQGYVRLPRAVRAAEVGHGVVGYDVGPHRVQQLAAGQSYVRCGTGGRNGARWHLCSRGLLTGRAATPPAVEVGRCALLVGDVPAAGVARAAWTVSAYPAT